MFLYTLFARFDTKPVTDVERDEMMQSIARLIETDARVSLTNVYYATHFRERDVRNCRNSNYVMVLTAECDEDFTYLDDAYAYEHRLSGYRIYRR